MGDSVQAKGQNSTNIHESVKARGMIYDPYSNVIHRVHWSKIASRRLAEFDK